MDEDELKTFLAEAEPNLKHIEVAESRPSETVIYAPEVASALARRFREDPDIDLPDPGWLAWGPGRRRVTYEEIARLVIKWADSEGPKAALAKLRQLGGNAATEIIVMMVSGITLQESIEVNGDTTICSLSSIPNSRGKQFAVDLLKGPLPSIKPTFPR